MMLWAILTTMIAAAAVLVSAPFLRRLGQDSAASAKDIAVYRDQLDEIDRDIKNGQLDIEQADAARAEIKRRVLTSSDNPDDGARPLSLPQRNYAVVAVAGIVVLGSIGLYASLGRPDLPASTRVANGGNVAPALPGKTVTSLPAQPTIPAVNSQQAGQQTGTQVGTQAGGQAPLGTVDDMIQRLVSRLQSQPNDGEGWRMLGWSYFGTDRFADAANAYEKAAALTPQRAGLKTSWGEALVRAAKGRVTAQSSKIFDEALLLDAKDPRARFFKGLAREQAGDGQGALNTWLAILKDATPQDAWAPDLRKRATELAGTLGRDISSELGPKAQVAGRANEGLLEKLNRGQTTFKTPPDGRGPTAEDVKAAKSMTPADRMAMIRGMVDGLAQRLETSPRDSEGWIKLMRSRMVLGEKTAAKTALAKALGIFKDAPVERQRIEAAAKALGVSS